MPNDGPNPHSQPLYTAELIGKGFRGVRYEVQWGIVETTPNSYNWNEYQIDSDITYLRSNGCTICIEGGYTPGFRTGQRYRVYPPLVSVDTPVTLTFSNNQATIPHAPVFMDDRNGERQGPFLIDTAETKQYVTTELCSFAYVDENNNRYTRTSGQGWADKYCAYTSQFPIDLSSLVVEVETPPGSNVWETWTRVDRIDGGSSGKVYYADHTGRIAFKDSRMPGGSATAPPAGARVRVSYWYYNTVYQRPTAYTIDKISGVVTKGPAGFSVPETQNDFSSSFGSSWQWYDRENSPGSSEKIYDEFSGPELHPRWSISGTQPTYTVDGKFNVTMPAGGSAEISAQMPSNYTKDWLLTVDMSSVTTVAGSGVGLVVRADTNNYFRAYLNHNGQLVLQKVEGGISSSSTLGWAWSKTRRLFLRKRGNQFQAWVSGLEDNQSYLTASFSSTFVTSSLGMWVASGTSGSTSVSFDDLYLVGHYELPTIAVSGGAVTAPIWPGINALYLQPVTGGGANFQISLKTSMPTVTGANRSAVGIYALQDDNTWIKVEQISDGGSNRKFRVVAVQNGSSVHDLMDGFNEAETVTLRLTRTGDTFTATMSPKTAYATNRTFSMPGFTANWVGIILEHQPQRNPITVTVDDWAVDAQAESMPDTVKCLYHRVDLSAVQSFGAALAQQFGDRVRHFEYGNEISNGPGWTWTGGIGIYAKCLEAFSQGVKSVISDAKVLNAGWADSQITMHSDLYNYIPADTFDIAACHPYWFSRNYPGTGFDAHAQKILDELSAVGDSAKKVFAGEFSTQCGALVVTGQGSLDGPNERRQAEYAFHAICKMLRSGMYEAVQWWPGMDGAAAAVSESVPHGARDGLFSTVGGAAHMPKPVFHILSEIGSCRGILVDLVNYSGNDPIPASRKHPLGSVRLKVRAAENLRSVEVQTSLTAWPADATVDKVSAVQVGGSGVVPVIIDPANPDLINDRIRLVWNSSIGYWDIFSDALGYIDSVSGGELYYSEYGWSLTMPPDPPSDMTWVFEVPVGDGWTTAGQWSNPGVNGQATITVPLVGEGRYLKILMNFDNYVELAQITVRNAADEIISDGKLYYATGWEAK